MAGESQLTTGNSKTQNAQKISRLPFNTGMGLIGECGVASYSKKAVRRIIDRTKNLEIDGEFVVCKIAEEELIKIRLEILTGYQKRNYSHLEQQEIFKKEDFGLMIAH
jgi:hypothetical protein